MSRTKLIKKTENGKDYYWTPTGWVDKKQSGKHYCLNEALHIKSLMSVDGIKATLENTNP